MIDEKWEEEVMAMSKHKLLEAVEKLNAYKALYYLLSIEKANK